MQTKPDFQQVQQQFCQAIRQADPAQLPQLQAERLQLYRELLLNNITSFIDNVYPIAKSLLPESLWQQLIHERYPLQLDYSKPPKPRTHEPPRPPRPQARTIR